MHSTKEMKKKSYTFTSLVDDESKGNSYGSIWKSILFALVCFALGAALVKYGTQQDTTYVDWQRSAEAAVGENAQGIASEALEFGEQEVGRRGRAAPRPAPKTPVISKTQKVTKQTVQKVDNKVEEGRDKREERRDNVRDALPDTKITHALDVVDVFADIADKAAEAQKDKIMNDLCNFEVKPGMFVDFVKKYNIVTFTAATLEKIKDITKSIVGFAYSMSVKATINICGGHDCKDIRIADLGIASSWIWYGAVQAVKFELDFYNGKSPSVEMFCDVDEMKKCDQNCKKIEQSFTKAYYCNEDEDRQDISDLTFGVLEVTKIFNNEKIFKPKDVNTKPTNGQTKRMREFILNHGVPCFGYDYAAADEAVCEHMAFSGFASHRLAVEPADESLVKVDLSSLNVLGTRGGFKRYGGCAYFDAATHKLKQIEYENVVYTRSHPKWQWAMYVWRSSVFLGVTAIDHLAHLHYLVGQQGTTASRENLAPNHPLRRFMKPFTYGQNNVNKNAAYLLFPHWAALQRATGLSESGLDLAVSLATFSFGIKNAETEKAKLTTMTESFDYPYGEDYLDAYATVEAFVKNFFDLYYPTQADLDADQQLKKFWFATSLGQETNNINYKREYVENYVAQFIFGVTFTHQHVGTVADWTTAPKLGSWKIRSGETYADLAYLFQVNAISITTGLPMIKLVGFDMKGSKLYDHLEHEEDLYAGWDAFQESLAELETTISDRNAARGKEMECLSFLPSRLGISISV